MCLKQVLEIVICFCGISGSTERLLMLFKTLLRVQKATSSTEPYSFPKYTWDLPAIKMPVVSSKPCLIYSIIGSENSDLARVLVPPALEAMQSLCDQNHDKTAEDLLRDYLFELQSLDFIFTLTDRDGRPREAD